MADSKGPAEIAPQIAENATPPKGEPPATPPTEAQDPAVMQAMMDQTRMRYMAQMSAERDNAAVPESAQNANMSQSGMDDLDKVLFGPTMRPNEPITAGMNRAQPGHTPIPQDVVNNMQALVALASRPDAPPEVQMLLAAITREMQS